MAEPKTDLNESLCCIALRFIDIFPNEGVEEFNIMISNFEDPNEKSKFKKCLQDVEIGKQKLLRHATYKSAYKDDTKWIKGSFYSAKAIKEKLNLNLSDYIVSRPNKGNRAFIIKEECTKAIKNWASVYEKSNVAKVQKWSRGILGGSLKSDKINIGDIILIKKQSTIYDEIKKMQEETIKFSDFSKIDDDPNILTKLLTPKNYNEYMNRAWLSKEIYSISLKQVQKEDPPLKLLNLDNEAAKEYNNHVDEFRFLITSLIGAAKSGSLSNFENLVKRTIDLEPVLFTANDRLDVKYKLHIKNLKLNNIKSYDYTMWTNFGSGNSVYFSPAKSSSASGEGGITLSYFNELVHDIPELKKFISSMKEKREEYFNNSCEKNGVEINQNFLGDSNLSSPKYDSMLYTSEDFKKLVHVLLTNTSYNKSDDVITPVEYKYAVDEIVIDNFIGTVGKGEKTRNIIKKITIPLKDKALERIKCLEDFFSTYVNFLSNNNHSMGTYFGISESYKKALDSRTKNIKEAYDKKYNDLILARLIDKIVKQEERKSKSDRISIFVTKTKDISPTNIRKQLKNNKQVLDEYNAKFKILDRELKKFAAEAIKAGELKNKHIEPAFKKSFALLANAEFGYMYSNHAEEINELVKKQVLLSLYAAASGRGYIIFDGQRFHADDYFNKDIKGVPFLKVGM